jgi:inosine/xanthosine triphosphate pyrophosphatase family protein
MIGYAHDRTNFYFFEGIVHGAIVMPISDRSFGWDYIFKPEGYDATFAEMDVVSKNSISPRAQAVYKLKSFLGYE